jgi:PAS domain S-box-containing protein
MADETPAQSSSHTASADDVKLIAGYPGSAILVDATGKPIVANAKGAGLEKALSGGAVADIEALIASASSNATIASATITIATSRGDMVLDVTATPLLAPDGSVEKTLVIARDLTMERNLRSTLVESRQRYKDLVEISNDFSWEVDSEGQFIFVSPQGALGYKPDELIGKKARDFVIDPDELTPFPFTTTRKLDNIEIWLTNKDRSTACMVVSALPLVKNDDETETWIGCRGVCRDVTEERESEAALARARHREQLLNYIVSQIRDEIEPHDMLMAAATATARAGCGRVTHLPRRRNSQNICRRCRVRQCRRGRPDRGIDQGFETRRRDQRRVGKLVGPGRRHTISQWLEWCFGDVEAQGKRCLGQRSSINAYRCGQPTWNR